MSDQEQFLDVVDRDEAEARFWGVLDLSPLGAERVPLDDALGRVLAADVLARVDVPSFDRSNFDGFAVRAADTLGASELVPAVLHRVGMGIDAGMVPAVALQPGEATPIATGGMLPRGADAVLMIEHSEPQGGQILARRALSPGHGIAYAGSDIAAGETVLRAGTLLTARETGVLAAIGEAHVDVYRRPRVAIVSTGDEIIAPGQPMRPALVYDSNARILADAVRELGGEPNLRPIVRDDLAELRRALREALAAADVVLLSGGTSKGRGDLSYRVVGELDDPGIVVHGVALKPGKPLCLAVSGGKPVVILPGFPTSAIFTFREFVAPVLRRLAGRAREVEEQVTATLAVKANSEIGRTEYLLVGLVAGARGLSAFSLGKGSGSVTTFSRADGFVTIPRHVEILEAGQEVQVQLLGRGVTPADLVAIGSHCVGLDELLTQLHHRGVNVKLLSVGSSAGLAAARRGECDLAGIHLLDPQTGQYNRPFLTSDLELVAGYRRSQGLVYRRGEPRFQGSDPAAIVAALVGDPACVMVNRNQGSGTRILIDRLLGPHRPAGYANQPTSHNAVAAAVAQGRADWGVAIASVARGHDLGFLPYQDEQFDFAIPRSRLSRPAVQAFIALLREPATRARLRALGCEPAAE